MKLLIAFIQKEDSQKLLQELRKENLSVTAMESEGGFLRRKNVTLFMALQDDQVKPAQEKIKSICKTRTERVDTSFAAGEIPGMGIPAPAEIPVGGATMLVLDIKEMVKI